MKGLEFGTIAKRRGSWTFRYYTEQDGRRVQTERTLCEISDEYRTKKDALPKAKKEIERLNAPQSGASRSSIAGFVETVYLPFVDRMKRPATANGYRKLWNGYLKAHFGKMRLSEYEPTDAAKFLDKLVERGLKPNTVHHVRSLMSAIFKKAVRDGLVKMNPIHDAAPEFPSDTFENQQEQPHYTVKEMRAVLKALANYPQAQAAMALAFIGLRPSEIAALRWEDIGWQENEDGDQVRVIKVQQSYWRGTVAPCKNRKSRRAIALGATVEALLGNYGVAVPSAGYIFENSLGNPLDLNALSRDVIRPVLKQHGLEWKKYYAGRRGAETEMNRHTKGNSQVTSHHFGHSKEVADAKYIFPIPEETCKGSLALDGTLAGWKNVPLRDKQGISLTATSAK